MIIAIKPSSFEPCIKFVDSSTTRVIRGTHCGESYYGIGGYFHVSDKIQKYRITEYHQGVYIERYFVGPKGYLFHPKWRSDKLLCQIMIKTVDPRVNIYRGDITHVLIDRRGIEKCLKLYNDLSVNTKFLSNIFYKCVKAECENDAYLGEAFDDAECSIDQYQQLSWVLSKHLNHGREFIPHYQPEDIMNILLTDFQSIQRGYIPTRQLLYSVEDLFVPDGSLTFPNRFSAQILKNPGTSQDEIMSHVGGEIGRDSVCTDDVEFMDLAKYRYKIKPITYYNEAIMDLIDVCSTMVYSDLYFEYISLKCGNIKSTVRYAGVILDSVYSNDILRNIATIIIDDLMPTIGEFKFYKTYDQEIYIEANNELIVIDMVLGNIISLALHR